MFQNRNSRSIKLFLWLSAIVCFSGPIILYSLHHASNLEEVNENISCELPLRPLHLIQGFCFSRNLDGRKTILIKAEKFTIEKKKVGYFRFGLMNEAILENVFIHLYGRLKKPEIKSDAQQNLTFGGSFSGENLQLIPVKRISSIVMKPVQIDLYAEQVAVGRISSSTASIRLKNKDILFKGDVKVESGSRVLTTDQLILLPDEALIKMDHYFVLKTPEKQLEGRQLVTDIFLTSGLK